MTDTPSNVEPETVPLADVPPTEANPVVTNTTTEPVPTESVTDTTTEPVATEPVTDTTEPVPTESVTDTTTEPVTDIGEVPSETATDVEPVPTASDTEPEPIAKEYPYPVGDNGLPDLDTPVSPDDQFDCIAQFLAQHFGYTWDMHVLSFKIRRNYEAE